MSIRFFLTEGNCMGKSKALYLYLPRIERKRRFVLYAYFERMVMLMRKGIFRSVTVFALSAAVAMSSCIGSAAQGLVKIYYDGNVITPEPEPVIVNDRTMVSAEDFLSKTKIGFDKKEDGALTVKSGEKSV